METNKIDLETLIDSIIVYQTGVQITQIGFINLSTGEQLLCITNLPESLDKESIRVKGLGNGKIVNIIVEYQSKKEYRTEEHKKLQQERERIEKEIKKTQRDLTRVSEQITKFKTTEDNFYAGWSKAFAFGEVDISQFVNFDEKINSLLSDSQNTVETLEERLKELRLELQVIRNKASKLGPSEEVHNFYEIMINLDVLKEGDFKLEIRYTMGQAWWVPFYDVALSEENARLTMMANVFNRTGVDWNNIEVEISTASLKPIQLVKPSPMILEEYIRQELNLDGAIGGLSRGRRDYRKADKLMAGEDMESDDDMDEFMLEEETAEEGWFDGEPEPEIEESYAEISENIGVQSFKIPNRINIPSDMNPHPVNLTILDLETEKKYFWSSTAPENVIIQDRLKNGDLLLLAGNVKIYYLEEFLGETTIPIIAPKEEFKIGTRVSYDLKIDKKIVDRSKAKKAIKGNLRNDYAYKITIKNLNKVEQDLTLFDRIPHSNSEKIKVEIEKILPEPSKKELGILKWKLNLKGIDEKIIEYKYFVEYKKEVTITPSLP